MYRHRKNDNCLSLSDEIALLLVTSVSSETEIPLKERYFIAEFRTMAKHLQKHNCILVCDKLQGVWTVLGINQMQSDSFFSIVKENDSHIPLLSQGTDAKLIADFCAAVLSSSWARPLLKLGLKREDACV